ncbi:sensor histidine kinase [Micromonospora sp. NBC_00617]|uniref:sensor histidine kinase n=1 Tax=Micromonospora sp. NBC_00617 TaxID=2903587 RepID=UPI0030E404B8
MRADRHAVGQDVALALGLLALGALQVGLQRGGWAALVGVACVALPVAARRSHPLPAVALSWGVLLVSDGLGHDVTSEGYAAILALVLTVYSVARHGHRWEQLAGLALALAFTWVSVLINDPTDVPSMLLTTVIVGAPWAAGYTVRASLERRDQVVAENLRLISERERHTREAIASNRTEIARDLHDVLGHSLAVMVMQLGAADHAFTRDPTRARLALRAARSTGKEAMDELRTLVTLFREEPGTLGTGPTPRLVDVAGLVDELTSAGLDVRLDGDDRLPALGPAEDLAAYRIVQESLTNAVRHGSGDVRVRLESKAGHVHIVIDNRVGDARASDRREQGSHNRGFGLIGMEERARSCGGWLRTTRPPGRFRLEAAVPIKVAA